jgi:hypothetical protein
VVDGSEAFLVERGFREVVVIVSWEGEVRIVGGVSDLGETVVYRISRVWIGHLDILIIHRISPSTSSSIIIGRIFNGLIIALCW